MSTLIGGMFHGASFLLWLIVYVYMALAFAEIARKTSTPDEWMAWVPIVNLWLAIQIAQKEAWWFILFFIPIVNLVASVIIMMAIAERLGKPSWWGVLIVVPVVQLVVPGYLAWG